MLLYKTTWRWARCWLGIGMIGFLSRRNVILMFLAAELMLQGVSVSLVAWSRYHNDFGGQMLVVFIIAVAACEAAVALALALALFGHTGRLDTGAWYELREACPSPLVEEEMEASVEESAEAEPAWPQFAAGGGSSPKCRPRKPSTAVMFDLRVLLIAIPALPLAAAMVIAVLGKRVLGDRSHVPLVAAIGLSCVLSLMLVYQVHTGVDAAARVEGGKTVGYEKVVQLWTWAAVEGAYEDGRLRLSTTSPETAPLSRKRRGGISGSMLRCGQTR